MEDYRIKPVGIVSGGFGVVYRAICVAVGGFVNGLTQIVDRSKWSSRFRGNNLEDLL